MYSTVRILFFFVFKQKTAYELRISDWSSDLCSSDLLAIRQGSVVRESERPRHLPASVVRAAADRRPVQHLRQPDRRRVPRSAAQALISLRVLWRGRVRLLPHLCRVIRPPQLSAVTYPSFPPRFFSPFPFPFFLFIS